MSDDTPRTPIDSSHPRHPAYDTPRTVADDADFDAWMAYSEPPSGDSRTVTDAPFVTYEMADGSMIWDEYKFVTELEFFEDRSDEIRLIKKTYRLISAEEVVLPDPYPIGNDADD